MLGVSGAKSFSGFMVATRGVPRSPATPRPATARAALGARRVCGSALPPAPAHGPRSLGPACLVPPPRAASNLSLVPAPAHFTLRTHATSSSPAPVVLKGRRPCCTDHVTPQRLPPSASRTRPSTATPPHAGRLWVGHAPAKLHLLLAHSRLPPALA